MSQQRKAIALISGGLDSMLAAKCIQAQGIHVEGLNFFTGFCVEGHTHAIRHKDKIKQKRNNALWVAEQLGIRLHIIDVVEEYKKVVINPRFGYGANLNPCLDCKVFMIQKAKQWMEENNFDFIITGEVIGQRPKSQKKQTMPIIAKCSGANERLLRPLCAQCLPPTLPELEGWVDRKQLFNFTGRSRKPQIQLAKNYQIQDYSQPAGGCCFLTDKYYSAKLADLWQSQGSRQYELDDIMLLKVGRHLRPASHFKLIIGREKGENRYLEGYRKQFDSLTPISHLGPLMLIDGEPVAEDYHLAARILARYCDCPLDTTMTIALRTKDGITTEFSVHPLSAEEILSEWYIEKKEIPHLHQVVKRLNMINESS
ncbi:MAG: tRNA (5-methylaminomethyl-2-thiouridylate)-methyltransferase [Candidatus Berkiellales bacterium]